MLIGRVGNDGVGSGDRVMGLRSYCCLSGWVNGYACLLSVQSVRFTASLSVCKGLVIICLSVSLSVYVSVCLCVCLSVSVCLLSVCLSVVCLSVCLSVVCLSVCLSKVYFLFTM